MKQDMLSVKEKVTRLISAHQQTVKQAEQLAERIRYESHILLPACPSHLSKPARHQSGLAEYHRRLRCTDSIGFLTAIQALLMMKRRKNACRR
jgi:hypothetical protein